MDRYHEGMSSFRTSRLPLVASLTIIWCLTATAADAIIVEYPSIEWLCDSSPHIGIAWATAEDPNAAVWPQPHAIFHITSVLKGHPPASLRLDCWNGVRSPRDTLPSIIFSGDRDQETFAISATRWLPVSVPRHAHRFRSHRGSPLRALPRHP